MPRIAKEFTNNIVGKTVRLEADFANAHLPFYSVTTVTQAKDGTGINSYDSAVFGGGLQDYDNAHDEFHKRVIALI
jgi:hypothetical protein